MTWPPYDEHFAKWSNSSDEMPHLKSKFYFDKTGRVIDCIAEHDVVSVGI